MEAGLVPRTHGQTEVLETTIGTTSVEAMGLMPCPILITRTGYIHKASKELYNVIIIKPVNAGLLSLQNSIQAKNFASTGTQVLHRMHLIITQFILVASSCTKAQTKEPAGKLFLLI